MRRVLAFSFVMGALVPVTACLEATQLTLSVRTNAPCTDPNRWKGVAVYVGAPGVDTESRAPTLTTTACDGTGNVGTLVITPSGSKDAQVGIRVVAGLDKNPEECGAASYAGCIVARRTVSFVSHGSETVIVNLTTDCTGRACDLNHTCVNGNCTDTVIAAPPVAPDGGVPTGPVVRCGDNGVTCPANDPTSACCLSFDQTAKTTAGECRPVKDCPPSNVALQCGSASDCAGVTVGGDAGPAACCFGVDKIDLGNSSGTAPERAYDSYCAPYDSCPIDHGGFRYQACEDRLPCPVGPDTSCRPLDALPGYFFCGQGNH